MASESRSCSSSHVRTDASLSAGEFVRREDPIHCLGAMVIWFGDDAGELALGATHRHNTNNNTVVNQWFIVLWSAEVAILIPNAALESFWMPGCDLQRVEEALYSR